ncbi:hypothetical protein [Tardiphaga sp.]|uniref:hypothetical protein n=1 Tax=Tardiphaga sp. TaxID=1926292 RepID=UPI00352AFFC4
MTTRGKTRVIGDIRERRPGFLNADLDREYPESLKQPQWSAGRVKPDVRLSFVKPPVTALRPKTLVGLTSLDVTRAVAQVPTDNGHRAACKTLTTVRSAANSSPP